MPKDYPCDICQAEPAAQMLTNVESGAVMMLGMGCLPVFYGQSLLSVIGSDPHSKIHSKCQACRRVHELLTVVPPAEADTSPVEPAQTPATEVEPA